MLEASPRTAPPAAADVERFGSAVQDPTRRRILVSLLSEGMSRTVDEVATMAGVHRTVAFNHLERLVNLGYLDKSQRRGRRGKPASLYTARAGAVSLTLPARQFALLASLLAEVVRSTGAVEAVRRTGVQFGRTLAQRRGSSVRQVVDSLNELGGEYRVDSARIVATNCIFKEACDESRHPICALHAAILEGALRSTGSRRRVDAEGPAAGGGCSFTLAAA